MTIKGWKSKLGVALEDHYATPVAVTDQYGYLSAPIVATRNLKPVPGVDGEGDYKFDKHLGIRYTGSLSIGLPYFDSAGVLGRLLYLALGSSQDYGDPTLGCYYYLGGTKPSSATVCVDKQDALYEYSGSKLLGIRISGIPGDLIKCEYQYLAKALDRASTTNPNTSGWTLVETPLLLFSHLTFMINDESGAALSSGDEVLITTFEINVNGDWVVKQDKESGLYIAEPKRKKWEVIGSITLASDNASTLSGLLSDFSDGTHKKIEFEFTTTVSGVTYSTRIWLPSCRITMADDAIAGEAMVNPTIRFRGFKPSSAPTGFPSITSEAIFDLSRST